MRLRDEETKTPCTVLFQFSHMNLTNSFVFLPSAVTIENWDTNNESGAKDPTLLEGKIPYLQVTNPLIESVIKD